MLRDSYHIPRYTAYVVTWCLS